MAKIKKFFGEVTVAEGDGGFLVLLDGRPVRSPHKKQMVLPDPVLAEALAEEWRQQGEEIEVAAMSLMRLVGHVVDAIGPEPEPARAEIIKYARSDLLCYRATHPSTLVARQAVAWDPVLKRFRQELGAEFRTASGIIHVEQDESCIERVRELVDALDVFPLAGAHALTTLTGSALIALALERGWLEAETAWHISQLDEDFQAEMWGADKEAMQRRQLLLEDFSAALRLLATTTDRARGGD